MVYAWFQTHHHARVPRLQLLWSGPYGRQQWNEHYSKRNLRQAATCSGVSRISARGVLKVRPHTKSGGAIRFGSDTKSGWGGRGGGQSTSGPIYEKWGVRYEKGGGPIPLFGTKKILYR